MMADETNNEVETGVAVGAAEAVEAAPEQQRESRGRGVGGGGGFVPVAGTNPPVTVHAGTFAPAPATDLHVFAT